MIERQTATADDVVREPSALRLRVWTARQHLVYRARLAQSRRYERTGRDLPGLERIADRSARVRATLVTVAFNTPALIASQADALHENFSDSFVHVVVDNSTLTGARRDIRALCEDAGAEYVALPPSPARTGSQSHGLALNWATTNVLRRSASAYFGFLDHDIFPFARCSYAALLQEQGSYGHFQRAGGQRFYWPGLMFFNRQFLSRGTHDFQPRWLGRHYGDTGAGNCTSIYPKMDLDALRTMTINDFHAKDPSRAYVKTSTPLAFQAEAVTVLDDHWLHLVNGSNWAADSDHAQKLDDLSDIMRLWSERRPHAE